MFAIIFGWVIILITVLLTTLFILLSYNKIDRTPTIAKIERYLEKFFRGFLHVAGGVGTSVALSSDNAEYRCKHCGYLDSVNSQFCLSCKKDDNGSYAEQVISYKCNFCFNTFSTNSKYCPKCARDNKGKYKGGIS